VRVHTVKIVIFKHLIKIIDLDGEIINYFENIVSDNDILYGQEFILMHQDSHNTKKNDEYQSILGNYNVPINIKFKIYDFS